MKTMKELLDYGKGYVFLDDKEFAICVSDGGKHIKLNDYGDVFFIDNMDELLKILANWKQWGEDCELDSGLVNKVDKFIDWLYE